MIAEASARLREKLLKKEEMLNQRLQDLTHDLKSPLTGLYCQIETLELIAPEPKDEMFHHIYNELGYLNHMVEDMSELSKLEKNRNPVNRQILRTEELAESLTGRFTPIAESGGIMISTDVSPLELSGDPVLLERAVGNLMHNAILHGSGPAVSLRIKPEEEGSGVTVEVENDGQIPEEDLPRIFNRYWRLNRNGQGSGLGLNIASVVIRKHGGELKVKNCSGNRVLFSFTIPQPN